MSWWVSAVMAMAVGLIMAVCTLIETQRRIMTRGMIG